MVSTAARAHLTSFDLVMHAIGLDKGSTKCLTIRLVSCFCYNNRSALKLSLLSLSRSSEARIGRRSVAGCAVMHGAASNSVVAFVDAAELSGNNSIQRIPRSTFFLPAGCVPRWSGSRLEK